MYKLSRQLWILSILAAVYTVIALTVMNWPQSGWMIFIVGVLVIINRRRVVQLTSHGTARWAGYNDLKRAGMVDADKGIGVGHLIGEQQQPVGIGIAIKGLFKSGVGDEQACEGVQAAFKKKASRRVQVRLSRAIHTAIFSPSGGGKGVSIVIPFLRSCRSSCVVIDPKGENALRTAKIRREVFGQQIVLLDPFKVVTQTPDCLNVLDAIDANDPHALDYCRDLAKALVIRTGEEKEPFWNDAAEMWIAALIAAVVFYGNAKEGTRSLQSVRAILSNPRKLEMAIEILCESDLCGGLLARMGGQLTHFTGREKSIVLTVVAQHLRFLDTPAVVASTQSSTFDPALVRSGKLTAYLILPPHHMQALAPLLRVWITAMLKAQVASGLQEKQLTYFVLDEATSLGHLEPIDDAVDKYRGYGVRLLFIFQSLGQLHRCFPNGQEQTLLSNTSQIYFAVNDQQTAEQVSARLGERTIIVDSGGTNSGRSTNWSHSPGQSSRGTSSGGSDNWQPQARKLLQPSEVLGLHPRVAITFTPGVPPIRTWLTRYYEEDRQPSTASPVQRSLAACNTFITAAFLCLLSVGLAGRVTQRAMQLQAEHEAQQWHFDQPGVPADQNFIPERRNHVRASK